MLTVRTGNTSPFGRKIRIAVSVLGLEREVAIALASTVDPAIRSGSRTRTANYVFFKHPSSPSPCHSAASSSIV